MQTSALVEVFGAIMPLLLLTPANAAEPDRITHAAIVEPAANMRLVSETEEIGKSDKPISLHIRICFSSPGYSRQFCREVPLTPGAAGIGFDSMDACEGGKAQALDDWFRQAREVFGFSTGWVGKDYLITEPRCVAALERHVSG